MISYCYICSSSSYIDDHHVDCRHGEVSPDTVPLCRRCHRTYHDLGLDWFDDELIDRAIEVENMRRKIYGEPLFDKNTIHRSDYWYTKHGIRRAGEPKPVKKTLLLTRPGIQPLCGMQWVAENIMKEYPWQGMTVSYDGKAILALDPESRYKRGLVKSTMQMATNVGRYANTYSSENMKGGCDD